MPPGALPQEIHNLIVDAVAEDSNDLKSDCQTLCACAAASRVLLQRAYHHLFSHIHIHLDLQYTKQWESQNALRNFVPLLRSSLRCPDVGIARYLRRFELSIRPPDVPHSRFALMAISYSLSELFRAVYSLTRVEYLKLSAVNCSLSFESHDDGLYPVSADLIDLCHSPTLSRLALSNFSDVPTSLLRDSRIKHIDMTNVSFSSYSWELRKFVHQPHSISVDGACFHSLVDGLHGGGGLIDRFVRCQEAFGRLQTLQIRSNGVDDIPEYLKMAAAASNSLDTLHVHILADTPTVGPLLRASNDTSGILPKNLFHVISGLRTIRISFHHYLTEEDHSPESCFIKRLRRFLNTSTFPTSLQTLDIGAKAYVCIDQSYDIECNCTLSRTEHWGLLDAVLTKTLVGAVPRLRLFINFSADSNQGGWFNQDLFVTRTYKAIEDFLPDFCNIRLLPMKGQLFVICGDQQLFDSLGFI